MHTWLCCYDLLQLPVEVVSFASLALNLICSALELNLTLGYGSILQQWYASYQPLKKPVPAHQTTLSTSRLQMAQTFGYKPPAMELDIWSQGLCVC